MPDRLKLEADRRSPLVLDGLPRWNPFWQLGQWTAATGVLRSWSPPEFS